MKKLLIVALLLSLGGCATVQRIYGVITGTSVTPLTVYVAAQTYDASVASATNYLKLPLCSGQGNQVCRTQTASVAIVKAIRAGRPIRNQLEAAIDAGNGNAPVSASLLQTLLNSNQAIQQAFATYGVK